MSEQWQMMHKVNWVFLVIYILLFFFATFFFVRVINSRNHWVPLWLYVLDALLLKFWSVKFLSIFQQFLSKITQHLNGFLTNHWWDYLDFLHWNAISRLSILQLFYCLPAFTVYSYPLSIYLIYLLICRFSL